MQFFKPLGIFPGRIRIMDGTGTADHQQAMVAVMNNIGNRLA